jgi:hypothetical protein
VQAAAQEYLPQGRRVELTVMPASPAGGDEPR